MLEMGPIEQNLARQAALADEPLPERIANAPRLNIGLGFYLNAFFELDTERSHGWGLSRIPWSAVDRYAERNGLDDDEADELQFFIDRMDSANLKQLAEKMKRDAERRGKPT